MKTLNRYLANPVVRSIHFDAHVNRYVYTVNGQTKATGGLLPLLEDRYYPNYVYRRKGGHRKTKKRRRASSRAEGIKIDAQLSEYARTRKRPRIGLARAVVEYLESRKLTIVAAQTPAFVFSVGEKLDRPRVTCADLIVCDPSDRLYMVEVKAGYNQKRAQGTLRGGLKDVPNTRKNHWELQRHYTAKALRDSGIPIEGSYVVNVYAEGSGITIKKRKNPAWVKQLK